jgi:hypothetical protein
MYTMTDVATPALPTTILPASGAVDLVNGSPQLDHITSGSSITTVSVTIVPPSGWTLDSVSWSSGNGTYRVPSPGNEVSYSFTYTVSQGAVVKTNGGVFKIKKAGGS